jgi:hypothetical protein
MTPLPNTLASVIDNINVNIISNYKDTQNPLLPYFLANGRAFYNNLFMPALTDEVKIEKRTESKTNNLKLQETINVSTDKKVGYHY